MNNQEKAIAKEKKLEFWLGIFFLIPPILGVIAFVLCFFDIYSLLNGTLSYPNDWTADHGDNGGGGMSAAPIYLGLMAMVGAHFIKNSARYIFINEDSNKIGKECKENG